MWHAWKRRDKCTRFWWERPLQRDQWADQSVDGEDDIRMDLKRDWLGGCGLDSTGSI
jgi:hypothetical protein